MLSVGASLAQQIDVFDIVSGFGGVTQFKAWTGDVEPDGSQSGHGTIGAGGTLSYKDAYHVTNADGTVTYTPTALDVT